ncbi:hypothetical protein G7K71_14305 [Desulfofundulus sp. TPOSR]|uniref:hypothetical protein n=1 Tax=Desulfofundulus sp. TPOSR TaxID=2714340 RepID=UPI00140B719F|nr:hypothetical protein [Desulfofundulus sp. TPOSR]NHM28130.1 hypothetical protein [Desulfofundulus sp. TPOSR]
MRKVVALLVLAAFAVVALAVPAFAGSIGQVPPSGEGTVTAVGKVVYSTVEKPHYELVVPGPMYMPPLPGSGVKPPVQYDRTYILTGPFDFKAYEGKLVRVTGQVFRGPNFYMRGPVLKVTKIELLKYPVPVPKPAPKVPVVRPVGR